jgi:hypothetical protein
MCAIVLACASGDCVFRAQLIIILRVMDSDHVRRSRDDRGTHINICEEVHKPLLICLSIEVRCVHVRYIKFIKDDRPRVDKGG